MNFFSLFMSFSPTRFFIYVLIIIIFFYCLYPLLCNQKNIISKMNKKIKNKKLMNDEVPSRKGIWLEVEQMTERG